MNECIKLFLVANSEYDNLNNIDGVINSMDKIHQFFKKEVCDSSNIKYLINKNRDEIIQQLISFFESLKQNDLFIFYFCGHGLIIPPTFDGFLMATRETSAESVSFENGIAFNVLASNLNNYSVKKSIIIIDSCYSGLALKSMGDNSNGFPPFFKECPEGTVLITSTTSNNKSYSTTIDGKEHAAFSYYLWRALCNNKDQETNLRSIKDIFQKAKQLLSENKQISLMKPQIKCTNDLVDFKFIPTIPTIDQQNMLPISLEVIDWRITSKCNNNCQFCYALNSTKESADSDLSEDDINRIISNINKINFNAICITGGEPTLNNNLPTILEKLYGNNHSIYLSTNGTQYLEKKDDIENYLDKLSLPLDGYDEKSNMVNGRIKEGFQTVLNILDYYSKYDRSRKFNIKIATLLTKKNCNTTHFERMYELLKKYPIDIWKIYEFIPESRGACKRNRLKFELSNDEKVRVKDLVNRFSLKSKFKIEMVERKNRNAAYFIIQPNGTVIIPTENEKEDIVDEVKIGNILTSDNSNLISDWYSKVNYDNYINNIRVRDFKRPIILTDIQKKVLREIVSNVSLPSIVELSQKLTIKQTEAEKAFNDLHSLRVIKNTIPLLNLENFNLKTFLVTLIIKHNGKLGKQHIAEILCYNNHFGWVSEFENGNFRIAVFSYDVTAVDNIVANEIAYYLQSDLVGFETQTLETSYAFGEANLFTRGSKRLIPKVFEKKQKTSPVLTLEEYNLLEKFKTLKQLTVENVNELYFETDNAVMPIVESLVKKGVIEKLHAIIDTKLIGYNWYLIFVKKNYGTKLDKKEFSEFLYNNFKSLTHINCFEERANSMDCIMDFEVHVKSNDDVQSMIRRIENKYSNLKLEYTKVLHEHKFEFTTNTVLETIYENYTDISSSEV